MTAHGGKHVWQGNDTYSLLVGEQTCTGTMEVSVVAPREAGN